MVTKEEIEKVVAEILVGTDKFLVEAMIQPGNHIVVYIDGDTNVSIADCQDLSRHIEKRLELDYADHQLTVSSAGMDRPIRLLRQFRKRIGRELDITATDGSKISGILVRADEKEIELQHPVRNPRKETAKPNTFIAMGSIKSAKIVINFGKQ